MKGRNREEQRIIETVKGYGQEQLLRFWDELDDRGKDSLMSDLRKIDFNLLEEMKTLLLGREPEVRVVRHPEVICLPKTGGERDREAEAAEAGESLIAGSKVAVFTAAGGQSSRLGLDEPKGCYPVTPIKRKSLFQVHAEKIVHFQRRFGVKIPWLIMVSETNRDQTIRFFKSNGFFGLDTDCVRFIEQGMLPALDEEGKLFLRERHRVFLNPDGHGGTFSALADSGALAWLEKLGIEEIFYFQVDNVLVKVLDPVFIGYHVLNHCEMSSKCLMKEHPGEKVGVFVLEGGKVAIVEYSELERVRVEEGKDTSTLCAGNIAIHLINRKFAERKRSGGLRLPFHVAHKAIPYIDCDGRMISPSRPNGYKMETFIFDALKESGNSIILEAGRKEEFSPLKNKSGESSPETVLRDQLMLFARWFERAGIEVPRDEEGVPIHRLEISPLFAVDEEGFCKRVLKDLRIEGDTYIV